MSPQINYSYSPEQTHVNKAKIKTKETKFIQSIKGTPSEIRAGTASEKQIISFSKDIKSFLKEKCHFSTFENF